MTQSLTTLMVRINRESIQALAGLVWSIKESGDFECLGHWGFGHQDVQQLQRQWSGNATVLKQVAETKLPARASATATTSHGTNQTYELVIYPILLDAFAGLIQLFFERKDQAEVFLKQGLTSQQAKQIAEAALALPDINPRVDIPSDSGTELATELLSLIEQTAPHCLNALLNQLCLTYRVDRCSYYSGTLGQTQLLAISGPARFEQRALLPAALQQLVDEHLQEDHKERILLSSSQIAQEQGIAQQYALLSLQSDSKPAVKKPEARYLLLEFFDESPHAFPLESVCTDLSTWTLSFMVAESYQLGRVSHKKRWRKTGIVIILCAAILALPIPLVVTATGVYLPRERQNVFAPESGVIATENILLPADGQVVAGQTLFTITSRQLDLEISQVEGQSATITEQIRSLRSTRPEREPVNATRPTSQTDVSIQLAELAARLSGLQQELVLLNERKESLQVKSPLTGKILTWEPEHQLAGRPVSRGQLLLNVGKIAADWDVQADVSEQDLGFFKQGVARQNDKVSLSPHSPRIPAGTGRVVLISPAVQENQPGQYSAPVQIHADKTPTPPTPGARVSIRVTAGYYPAGYVWFRGVIESVRQFFTW